MAKGVKKCVIDKKLKFDDYDYVLKNETEKRENMNFIKSKKHNVNTIKVNKICLSCFDKKILIEWWYNIICIWPL